MPTTTGVTESGRNQPKNVSSKAAVSKIADLEEKLKAVEETIKSLQKESKRQQTRITELKTQITDTEEANQELKQVIKQHRTNIKRLETQLSEHLLECEQESESSQGVSRDESDGHEERIESAKRSVAAMSDPSLNKLICEVYQLHMGVGHLTATHLPDWPKDEDNWPIDKATGKHCLRFKWDLSATNPSNFETITELLTYIRKNGGQYIPQAIPALNDITNHNLKSKLIGKFNHLVKNIKAHARKQGRHSQASSSVPNGTGGEDHASADGDTGNGDAEANQNGDGDDGCQTRQKGKWELRDHKYKALPEDSEWHDPKYKPALVPTLMSDDEDEYNKSGCKTGRFVSCWPTWRSDLWMVSVTWLEELDNNTRYNNNSFISVSGVAWGDPEDPETLEEKVKTFKEEIRSIKNEKERLNDETGTRTLTKKSKKSSKMSQQKKSKK
ncbi:hypothetical protein NEOLEDRAFT_1149929 [Neolentinus lepideus HHB14362 ss-1]|uniref:Uncharacterized protein n=1 Tax=Neolentinus lepideus HHB14362 ss-1 TaxID=1314782 RepID=A0A165QKK2_9AGAM|nr:hypothetical protein NEOLEDRAFT_1149929 [Neolentinus lepideus HHB14362 ss-1]